jgi:3-oxoacyl-[acyl-carrier protein] reductase
MTKNKETILLIGGSSDLGREIARQYRGEDVTLLVHYSKSLDKVKALQAELSSLKIVPLKADLSKTDDVMDLIAQVGKHGTPDKIVHMAAPKSRSIYFRKSSWADFSQDLDVQLRSAVMILREFLPLMANREKGKVVFVLSSFVLGAPPQATAHYTATKHALLGLMQVLAAEYVKQHVLINAVSPSMMQTAFLDNLDKRLIEIAGGQAPLGRLALPTDVAPLVKFLLSPQADYIVGANIPVAGGTSS